MTTRLIMANAESTLTNIFFITNVYLYTYNDKEEGWCQGFM